MFIIEGGRDNTVWESDDIDIAIVDVINYVDPWKEEGDTLKFEEGDNENIMHANMYNADNKFIGVSARITYISDTDFMNRYNKIKLDIKSNIKSKQEE